MFIGLWVNIWVFNSIPLVNVSVFMPISSCVHYCSSIIEFEVRDGKSLEVPLLFMIVSAILGFFVFLYKVEYCSFKVCEEFC